MQQRGTRCGGANQIVSEQRGPYFAADHLGRFATHLFQIQRTLDAANIKLHIPAEAIQFGNLFLAVLFVVDECDYDGERFCSQPFFDNVVTYLAKLERLGNLSVGCFIHPLRFLWLRPDDEVIVLTESFAAAEITST